MGDGVSLRVRVGAGGVLEPERPEITVTTDGPYQVTGDVWITPKRAVLSGLGEPLTWASEDPLPHESPTYLCRCGQSASSVSVSSPSAPTWTSVTSEKSGPPSIAATE